MSRTYNRTNIRTMPEEMVMVPVTKAALRYLLGSTWIAEDGYVIQLDTVELLFNEITGDTEALLHFSKHEQEPVDGD